MLSDHGVNVEPALRVLAGRPKRQQVEDRLHVGIEAVVALAGKREVPEVERRERLLRIAIERGLAVDAVLRRILSVVALVVERCGIALVVGRDDTGPEEYLLVVSAVDLRHPVTLRQILGRIVDVLDDPEVGLENRLPVLERRVEPELVGVGRATCLDVVVADRHVDFVQDAVVEVVPVGPDARFLERVDGQRDGERLAAELADEGIHVGGIGGVVERDQRRIHVARRAAQEEAPGQGMPRRARRQTIGSGTSCCISPAVSLPLQAGKLLGQVFAFRREEHLLRRQRFAQPAAGFGALAARRSNDAGVVEEPGVLRSLRPGLASSRHRPLPCDPRR